MDEVTTAYIECALWAGLDWSRDNGGSPPPLDDNYGIDDVSPDAIAAIEAELAAFVADNEVDLEGIEPASIGHDFYLTRNGHGAGFWDRGYGERGDRLTAACKPYGESELYVGDDGKLYV